MHRHGLLKDMDVQLEKYGKIKKRPNFQLSGTF